MEQSWIIYAGFTVIYIIILVIYFLRRTKSHEKELTNFLQTAKQQLESHKIAATEDANKKVVKATQVIKKVQQVAAAFEEEAQKEYDSIIQEGKEQKREILATAKTEIEALFTQAEEDLDVYKRKRQREIEKNMVKMVVAVAEKVTEIGFSENEHAELIEKALEEIKQQKQRA